MCVCPTYESSSSGLLHHFPILFQHSVSSFLWLTALHVSICSSHIPSTSAPVPSPTSAFPLSTFCLISPCPFLVSARSPVWHHLTPHCSLSSHQMSWALLFTTKVMLLSALGFIHPYAGLCVIPTVLERKRSWKIVVGKQIRKLALIIASQHLQSLFLTHCEQLIPLCNDARRKKKTKKRSDRATLKPVGESPKQSHCLEAKVLILPSCPANLLHKCNGSQMQVLGLSCQEPDPITHHRHLTYGMVTLEHTPNQTQSPLKSTAERFVPGQNGRTTHQTLV